MPLKRSNGDTLDRKSKGGFGRRKSRGSNDDLERAAAAAAAAFVTTLEPNKSFRSSRGFADGNSGLKRKRNRIYADNGTVDAECSMKQYGMKSLSKAPQNVVGWSLDKGKKLLRGKAHKFEEDPGKSKLLPGSFDNKGKMESAHQLKNVQDKPFADTTTTTSKIYKRKPSFDSNRKYATTDSRRNTRGHGKKSLATDSDPPKKNKRVIRLDPHDTSNKRLNDDVPTNGNGPEKKDLAENTHVEMSKNAQFRAIRPSPSILSFVEDNFLGRRREIEFRRAGYNIELSAPLDNIPLSTSSERERIEVPVFRNKLEFFAAAKISSSFPPPDLPEIAFAGRSNVGKSSLLNSLTRQWGVVRTSDKPGLTQTINFFKLGPKLSLVDLPGYGFAYAKEEVKESWEELVKEYVTSRVGLKRVCLLVDTQWGMKPRDHELIDLMERSQTKYQIVLTKTDLVFPIDVARRAMQIEENLKAKKSAVQPLMMVSSKTGAGIRSLRTVLANIARFARR